MEAPFRTQFNAAADPQAAANALLLQKGVHVVGLNSAGGATISGNLTVNGNTVLGDAAADTVVMNAKNITRPNAPAVLAFNSVTDTNVTGTGGSVTVDFDTEVFDRGGDFAADTFTAPVTGIYSVGGAISLTDLTSGSAAVAVTVVTSNRTYSCAFLPAVPGTTVRVPFSIPAVDMDASDTLTVQTSVSGMAGVTADILGAASGGALITFVAISLVG